MSLRLFLPATCALSLSFSLAHAQTTLNPPATTELPMPPLTVPFHAAPLDAKTQGVLGTNKPRQFVVQLNQLSAPLVAYWIDPQNNPAPPNAAHGVIVKPEGVDRVLSLGTKVLLVFGTREGATKLQQILAAIETPSHPNSVYLESRIYWIDSSAPSSKDNKVALPQLRVDLPGEIKALDQLKEKDRAVLQSLTTFQTMNGMVVSLSFAPNGSDRPPGTLRSQTSPFFNPNIDPGMPMLPGNSFLALERSKLRLTASLQENNEFLIDVQGKSVLDSTNILKNGESLVLAGATSSFQIKAPSPRFDSFVLVITPRPLSQNPKPTAR